MDRFAFLASQPWLYPPPEEGAPQRGGPGHQQEHHNSVEVLLGGVPRLLQSRHLQSHQRTAVHRRRSHSDPSVVFDGCASFHFSEAEQYSLPPSTPVVVNNASNNNSNAATTQQKHRNRAVVVGAAAPDALH